MSLVYPLDLGNGPFEKARYEMIRTKQLLCSMIVLTLASFVGLACGDDDNDAADLSGNPAGVGNFCKTDNDCETHECYIGPGGGYCTSACTHEGSTSECPVDTVCKPIQGGPARCLLVCGSESACDRLEGCREDYCPGGSSCVSVSETDLRGCEPDPG